MPTPRVVSLNISGQRRATSDRGLAAVASRQHTLVAAAQLRHLGIDQNATEHRVRLGRLWPIHRGVFAVGHPELTQEGRLLAAVLALGEGAVLSHVPAAVHWCFLSKRWLFEDGCVDVTTPRRLKPRPGIRPHTDTRLVAADWTRHGAIPITTPARSLYDIATLLPDRSLRRAVHEAEVQRRVNHRQLRAQIAGKNTAAARALRAVIEHGPAPTRSDLEDDVLELLRARDLPRPRNNARIAGFEVDLLYADLDLVIEIDSDRYHGTAFARDNDAHKQALLEAAGFRVIRVSDREINGDSELTIRRIRRVMAEQAGRPARPACQTAHP